MDKQICLIVLLMFVLFISISTGCDDLDTQLCIQIGHKFPGICSDSCLSQLCKRSCGLCPVQCYECHEIDDPKNCSTVIECPTRDHYCFTTQAFADNFQEVYKLGCATKTICTEYFGDRIGRGLRVEATCCVDDKCNNMTPEEIENEKANHHHPLSLNNTSILPSFINDCHNIGDGICGRLAAHDSGFCQNHLCAATKLCPRMCGLCFRCYNCNDIVRSEACNTTSSCSNGQKCFTMETLSVDLRPVYRLGCMDVSLCQRFKVSPANIFGKRQDLQLKGGCCSLDLCNHGIQPVVMTAMTTTTTPKTTITTSHNGCRHYTMTACPSGFYQYHDSCYEIGTQKMTKQDAKAYCYSRCAHLADFDTFAHLETIVRHVKHTTSQNMWTDAGLTSHGGSSVWIWTTTGSTVSSDIVKHIVHSGVHSTHCGEITISSTNTISLASVGCDVHSKPLCKISLTSG